MERKKMFPTCVQILYEVSETWYVLETYKIDRPDRKQFIFVYEIPSNLFLSTILSIYSVNITHEFNKFQNKELKVRKCSLNLVHTQ
jgi:hypothetical protein